MADKFMTEEEKTQLEAQRAPFKEIVESDKFPVCDSNTKGVLYKVLANTTKEMNEATLTGDIAQYTPVLINMIRRVMPSLCANRLVGVQAMSAPTGRIFCQHVYYGPNKNDPDAKETWANGTVGTATAYGEAPEENFTGDKKTGDRYETAVAEQLGVTKCDPATFALSMPEVWPEMSFGVDYVDVSVKSRALKGQLSMEIIQDMKAVHGLDAEQELSNILQAEIVAEIDREIINRLFKEAKIGCQNTATKGLFDFTVDADGRWSMERVMNLLLQMERESTIIAQETRRGRGNYVVTSPELAAYLSMANLITLRYENTGFTSTVNPVGPSYYGKLCNRWDVVIDPYMSFTEQGGKQVHQMLIGYKGAAPYDAAFFYCPYVPIQFMTATDPHSFYKIIGLKTRYATCSNPYYCARNEDGSLSTVAKEGTNSMVRKFAVAIDNAA